MERLAKQVPFWEIPQPINTDRIWRPYMEIARQHNQQLLQHNKQEKPLPALTHATESTTSFTLTNPNPPIAHLLK